MAADVLALADHAGLGRFDLMGYSMGAHIALALALSAPGRVDRLILGGVGARLLGEGPPWASGMTLPEAMRVEDPSAIADPILKGFRAFADQQGDDRLALAACAEAGGSAGSRPDFSDVRAPALVVAGSLDTLAGDPKALAEAIPGAKAVTLPAADHFSAIPHALFKAAVFDFLDGWDEAEQI
ncbi:MAG: alpha/beta fold hydrolase [Caulobacteraceae bacterium]|nr:alpha/beta fold hydrolase [Caulobacteraceae bacterium]